MLDSIVWTGTNLYEVGAFLSGDWRAVSVHELTLTLWTTGGQRYDVPAGSRISRRPDGAYYCSAG